ncbi:hypothetical protein [Oryzibacter oryziterrae]|uniref:hypothetical protein n=1 Tax=Oryzibacter oryziterrae TaxID=2766474 RepID=UPI001F2D8D85|nr:hypothetical protein [Oryzibacter oryziterrae]
MASDSSSEGNGKVRRLSDAVRRVRIAEAERSDAFADLHEADRARLALLVEELQGVFAELPSNDDYFICEIAGSTPPRLWVDPTAHVMIGRDRRTYRFLKDTRFGRVVLIESADVHVVADAVTDYVAERVVERDRAQESDYLLARLRSAALPGRTAGKASARAAAAEEPALHAKAGQADKGSALIWALVLFLAGFAAGAIGLVAYAWFMVPGAS